MKRLNEEENEKAEAFVCINAGIGYEEEVLNLIKELPRVAEVEVDEAEIVFGVWDIVAKLSASTTEELNSVIQNRIRLSGQVISTTTLMVDKRT